MNQQLLSLVEMIPNSNVAKKAAMIFPHLMLHKTKSEINGFNSKTMSRRITISRPTRRNFMKQKLSKLTSKIDIHAKAFGYTMKPSKCQFIMKETVGKAPEKYSMAQKLRC